MSAAIRRRDMYVVLALQALLVVMFGFLTRYDDQADPRKAESVKDTLHGYYLVFQGVHIMIFVGFGFLMTFLQKYGYSSVGFNMLVAALVVQWAIIFRGILDFNREDYKIPVSVTSILEGDLAAAVVLISMGAVLGKTTPLQLLLMGVIEICAASANEHIGVHILKAVDAGASMYVHEFGAYFGLMVSLVLGHGKSIRKGEGNALEGATYTSDLFAMIGTLFLWMFWPSFNGALVTGDDQHRAVLNTYLSLASCCVVAFAVSAIVSKENKFDMVHIQNATLAGGVAIGTTADMVVQPFGAICVGISAGILSVIGYRYLQPFLLKNFRIHDTCGVNNLHGMPGVLSGLIGALMAGLATKEEYGYSLYQQFPARAPSANSTEWLHATLAIPDLELGNDRTASGQALYQLLALVITFIVACVTGAITGFILKIPLFNSQSRDNWFNDSYFWEVPEHEHTEEPNTNGTAQNTEAITE